MDGQGYDKIPVPFTEEGDTLQIQWNIESRTTAIEGNHPFQLMAENLEQEVVWLTNTSHVIVRESLHVDDPISGLLPSVLQAYQERMDQMEGDAGESIQEAKKFAEQAGQYAQQTAQDKEATAADRQAVEEAQTELSGQIEAVEKELETAEYFRNLSEEALWKIADTYTRKYRKEDCQAEKSVVQIFYRPGFERLVLAVLADLEKQGIEPVICIPASGVIARDELHGNVNPQYEADHKCDEALFLDKKYIERKLDVMKYGYECEKEWTARATGRIRLDRAEKELSGQAGPDAVSYMEEQKECLRIFDEKSVQLMNQYGLDITTPYEELEEISVLTKEGKNIILLEDGRFVTEGKKMPDGSFEK